MPPLHVYCTQILCLDFDGVLHRASDSIHLPATRVGGPLLQVQLKSQRRLTWLPDLESALGGNPDIAILVHSTWRSKFDMATLAGLLGGLQERVLQPPSFLVDSSALAPAFIRQSLQWVNESRAEAGRAPLGISDLLVLDDRKEFFIGDAELTQRLLLTNPDLGLSDEGTAAKLRRWADRMEDDAQGSHEDDGGHSSSSKY